MGGAAHDVVGLALAVATAALLLACRCAASSGGGTDSCMPELVSLSPCMDYMSGKNATAPDAPCCSALSGAFKSSPRCLCTVLGGTAASLGVAIDSARALRLPGACKVQAPSGASQCSDGKPTPDDTPPAADAPSDDADVTPAGSGSKATPTSVVTQYYSDGSISRPRMSLVFIGVSAMVWLRRF